MRGASRTGQWGIRAAFLFLLLALCAPPASAAHTYFVSPSGKDTNSGTSSKPFQTIQHGIDAASNGDTVTLQDGTYTGTGDVRLDFGGTNLTVNSVNGAGKAIIDCKGTYYAFNFHTNETAAVVSGLTIKNGYNNYGAVFIASGSTVTLTNCILTSNTGYNDGGGIYNAGTVTLTGCTLTNNVCDHGGGGIYTIGTATLTGCTFSKNSAGVDGFGGGLYNKGTATLTNCTLSNNSSYQGGGGAVNDGYEDDNGVILFTHCAFTENTASNRGGGLLNFGAATLTDCTFNKNINEDDVGGAISNGDNFGDGGLNKLTLTGCAFNGNKAAGTGGAIFSYGKMATLTDCTFTGNEADSDGGGFYNYSAATLTNCTFIGNRATGGGRGGGICNADYGDNVKLTNCVFSSNDATRANGGAIYNGNSNSSSQSNITLQFCTFAGNNAGDNKTQGGALENDGTSTVMDSILYGDTAPAGAEIGTAATTNGGAPVTTVTYSDIKGGFTGTGNLNVNPSFVQTPDPTADPPNYGDLHLNPASPVIGKGIAISGVSTDRDGFTRKSSPALGAYEYAPRINSLSPASAVVGGPAFTLTVSGVDFVSASVVKWNNAAQATHYVSSTKLTASIPASLIAALGTATVTVTTPSVATSFSKTFTITPPPVLLSSLVLSPASLTAGGSGLGKITLTAVAPAGGAKIMLASSNTAATVPASVTIAAGNKSISFPVTAGNVTATKTVTITATIGASVKTATLTVNPAPVTVASLSLSPNSVKGGSFSTGTITLTGPAPAGGLAVTQTSSNTAVATLAGTLQIATGATSARFKITTKAVTSTRTVTITSTANGVSKTAILTVTP